ncbi:MAG: hypothetical protein IT384_11790 [Deltaproteobacteria bacterium]|nr:hypothetical protein [Deltaproteobacteria bacterium]
MKKVADMAQRRGSRALEARLLAALASRGLLRRERTACAPAPEPDAVDPRAVEEANALFSRSHLPYGANEPVMRARVLRALDRGALGTALRRAPSTRSLHPLQIDDSRRAFLNPPKREFFVRITAANGARWYGPFPLDVRSPVVVR